jgi:hypothetical protein
MFHIMKPFSQLLSAVLFACALSSARAQIPNLAQVPETLPQAVRDDLNKTREQLARQREDLKGAVQAHNVKCGSVEAGSVLESECAKEQAKLTGEIASFTAAATNYNHQVSLALVKKINNLQNAYDIGIQARGEFVIETSDGRKLASADLNAARIDPGTRVTTGPNGHLQIVLPDETVFTIGPNSDMVLDDFVFDTDNSAKKITADVTKGIFRWVTGKVARKDPAQMKVKLPVGDLGIRGTDFEATVAADNSGSVKLFSGQLEIIEKKTQRVFVLDAGHTIAFNSTGDFSSPQALEQTAPSQ